MKLVREHIMGFEKPESEENFRKTLFYSKLKVIEKISGEYYIIEFPNKEKHYFFHVNDIRREKEEEIFSGWYNKSTYNKITSQLNQYKIPFRTWKNKEGERNIEFYDNPDYVKWEINKE